MTDLYDMLLLLLKIGKQLFYICLRINNLKIASNIYTALNIAKIVTPFVTLLKMMVKSDYFEIV